MVICVQGGEISKISIFVFNISPLDILKEHLILSICLIIAVSDI